LMEMITCMKFLVWPLNGPMIKRLQIRYMANRITIILTSNVSKYFLLLKLNAVSHKNSTSFLY
uniref:Ovule protein n=1 Tax=Rodentolepis nana TaxID=102285 RepID=A0A0R3T1M6_RODNA